MRFSSALSQFLQNLGSKSVIVYLHGMPWSFNESTMSMLSFVFNGGWQIGRPFVVSFDFFTGQHGLVVSQWPDAPQWLNEPNKVEIFLCWMKHLSPQGNMSSIFPIKERLTEKRKRNMISCGKNDVIKGLTSPVGEVHCVAIHSLNAWFGYNSSATKSIR